ncbi:MAG: FadR family transcriptional regulator [Phycisphaeraceae bacterium]|nr:FadR family transcriptional regulator [Phycisphaeraceae bacterium]
MTSPAPVPTAVSTRRRPPLVDEVAGELARRIRAGTPRPGDALPPERDLAVELGVSRPVLRESLRQLQSRGLVEIRHGVGVLASDRVHQPVAEAMDLVMPPGHDRLLQLAEARLLIEPHVAAQAARHATAAKTARLDDAQRRLMTETDPDRAIEHDLEFHRLLATMAGNAALLLTLDALADLGRLSRKITLTTFGVQRAWRQHQAILDAVKRQNSAAAAAAMKQHIQASARDLGDPRRQRANA